MKKSIIWIVLISVLAFILMFSGSIIRFIINIKWFNEVGYLSVYFTKLEAVIKLMVPIFIIIFISLWLYYRSLRSSIVKHSKVVRINKGSKSLERVIFFTVDFIISFFISFSVASAYWVKILQFGSNATFNVKDPIFNLDISFFIFKLPLIESLYVGFLLLLIILVIITVSVYFIMNFKDDFISGNYNGRINNVIILKSGITKFAGKQLAVVASLIMIFISAGYVIRSLNLVYSPRGVVFGASYTDMNVSLKFYYVIIAVALIGAVVTFISIIASKAKPIIISVIAILFLIVAEGLVSTVVQNLVVAPNTKTLEKQYIQNNIKYTRMAFNIDAVNEKTFSVNNSLTKDDIDTNKETIDNIKINSYRQSLEFMNQVQVMKSYYDFHDVDVDRYMVNGKYNQVFISPREMNTGALEGNATIWQNKHLQYTHGFGVVMSKVNSVTSTGQPDFLIKNIPPENISGIKLNDPRIYFGEMTNDYAVVDSSIREFDYPDGDSSKSNDYSGKAGIKLSFSNRLLFAINQGNPNFILSSSINDKTKILLNRNIVDRAKKIAPFLTYDKDPYIVINEGKLYWIMDAYTLSSRYPYSQPQSGSSVNYIRNSVKVVIDAVDGTTNFYIVDPNDPIAYSYSKIFPTLFKSLDKVPQGLKDHFRYPQDLFDLQCQVMGKYHVTDADTFYNGQDLWEIAQSASGVESEKQLNESTFTVMKLPGEQKEEMVLVNYFNAKGRDSLSGLFGARMDSSNYGKLVLYRFPTQKTINSPHLFKKSLQQDPEISKALSLWNTGGSNVEYGDTVIVPIKDSLLYVVPVYLRASGTKGIPEVKSIVVGFGDKIILAESIDSALKQIFNYDNGANVQPSGTQQPSETTGSTGKTVDSTQIQAARDLYQKAIEAQKSGDWAKYGDYIKSLGDILDTLTK